MNVKAPSYHSDPHVTYLSKLLEELRDGSILVPRFQRPLVWSWDDRLELLRSIRDGIPMGAVMVWRTSVQKLACYENLGPFRIRRPSGSPQYLLDGVQRLSTLLGALSPIDMIDDAADEFLEVDDQPPSENFEVHYDFEAKDFVRAEDVNSKHDKQTLPLSLLFDSVGMLRFQRGLRGSNEEVDRILEECDDLVAAFREYKVPVIPVVTDDVEMATRTFQRLNSQGKAMSEAHMIHALSWGEDFNLNISMSDLKTNYLFRSGWSKIDDDILLKACKMALGFGVYVKDADIIGKAFKENYRVIDDIGQACSAAVTFLKEHCAIGRPDLLPYALQLVLLTNTYRVIPNPTDEQVRHLISWFWTTTYCEYFAGMSGDRVEKARKDLEFGLMRGDWKLTSFDPFEVKRLNRKFDFRAVRAKAFALRLAEVRSEDDSSGRKPGLDGAALLNEFGRDALIQLLPRLHHPKVIYSSYANRFLIDPRMTGSIREDLLSGSMSDYELERIFVSADMLSLLKAGDHLSFVNERERCIDELEEKFYRPHLDTMGVRV